MESGRKEGRRHALGSVAVGVSLHGWLLMLDVPHVLMLGVETAPSELIVSSMNGNGEWLGGALDRKAGFGSWGSIVVLLVGIVMVLGSKQS